MLPTVKPDHKTKRYLSARRGRLLMLPAVNPSAKPKRISPSGGDGCRYREKGSPLGPPSLSSPFHEESAGKPASPAYRNTYFRMKTIDRTYISGVTSFPFPIRR